MGFWKGFFITLTILLIIGAIVIYVAGDKIGWMKHSKFLNPKWVEKMRFWNREPEPEPEKILSHVMIKAKDKETGQFIDDIKYMFKDGDDLISKGTLFSYSWEEINKLERNKTYTLIAYDDNNEGTDYYYIEDYCHIGFEEFPQCIIELQKQGELFVDFKKIDLDSYYIEVFCRNGMCKNPLICYRWEPLMSIIKAEMQNLQIVNAPYEVEFDFDRCYRIESILDKTDPILNKIQIIREISNLYDNCSTSSKLTKNESINLIIGLFDDCKETPIIKRDTFISELDKFYEICEIVPTKKRKDFFNSISALYQRCIEKTEKDFSKTLILNIEFRRDPNYKDMIRFLAMDEGDYTEGEVIREDYFDYNSKDVGIQNYEKFLYFNVTG